jgi:hypothetical protein
LGDQFSELKLFCVLHVRKFCDELRDRLAALALSRKSNDIFGAGNKPAHIIGKHVRHAGAISSPERCIKLLHQPQILLLAHSVAPFNLAKVFAPSTRFKRGTTLSRQAL